MINIIEKINETRTSFSHTSEACEGTFRATKFSNGIMLVEGRVTFLHSADEDGYIHDGVILPFAFVRDMISPQAFTMPNRNASQILNLCCRASASGATFDIEVWTENSSKITVDVPADIVIIGRWKT